AVPFRVVRPRLRQRPTGACPAGRRTVPYPPSRRETLRPLPGEVRIRVLAPVRPALAASPGPARPGGVGRESSTPLRRLREPPHRQTAPPPGRAPYRVESDPARPRRADGRRGDRPPGVQAAPYDE